MARRPIYVTYEGREVRLSILCRKLGLSRVVVARRLAIGWNLADALARPVRYRTPVLRAHTR